MHTTARRAVFAVGLLAATRSYADDWPMLGRDQSRNAVSPEKNPPLTWQPEQREGDKRYVSGAFRPGVVTTPSKNILWTYPLNGSLGAPVVVDGRVWIGTSEEAYMQSFCAFLCLDDKTGKPLFRYWASQTLFGRAMASSPLAVGNRMWFFNNSLAVVCLDISALRQRQDNVKWLHRATDDPRDVWKVDMGKHLGVRTPSPFDSRLCSVAAHADWLYVITGNGVYHWEDDGNFDVIAGKLNADAPSLVCFDKNNGNIVWQDKSPGKNILHSQCASPTIITIGGKTQVVAPQGDGWVRSFEAATGKLVWKFDTNPPDAKWNNGRGTRNYLPATAVFHDSRVFIGNGQEPKVGGRPAWLYCIDATKTGDISPQLADGPGKGKPNPNSGMLWKYGGLHEKTRRPIFHRTVSNVAVHDHLVIAADIGGQIHCLDEQTGVPYWVHETRATIQGSPLIAGGRVYVGDDNGYVWILELGKEKHVLNKIEMDGCVRASPVYANGVLYIATQSTLYAIAERKKTSPK